MKQETLEEVAEKWNEQQTTLEFGKPHNAPNRIKAFIEGAKWQQERSCSEEDMKKAYCNGANLDYNIMISTKEGNEILDKCFEQFKKK
jgi:O-methyltransferase involved in polyketide biosynthesis